MVYLLSNQVPTANIRRSQVFTKAQTHSVPQYLYKPRAKAWVHYKTWTSSSVLFPHKTRNHLDSWYWWQASNQGTPRVPPGWAAAWLGVAYQLQTLSSEHTVLLGTGQITRHNSCSFAKKIKKKDAMTADGQDQGCCVRLVKCRKITNKYSKVNESLNKQAELVHPSYLHKLTNEFALPFLSPCACFPQYGRKVFCWQTS